MECRLVTLGYNQNDLIHCGDYPQSFFNSLIPESKDYTINLGIILN